MDPFKVLGIERDATEEEIKRAYHAMASKYHPDAGGDTWVFQQVQAAYKSALKNRSSGSPGARTVSSRPTSTSTFDTSADAASTSSRAHKAQSKSSRASADDLHPSSATSDVDSLNSQNRTRQQTANQNATGSMNSATKNEHRVWNIFFGHLPLQNETNIFILVNVIDVFVTYVILRFGGIEANPIANFFFKLWNVQGMVAFKLTVVACVAIVVQLIARRNLRLARQVLILGTFVVVLVVLYSIQLLMRRVL